MTTRKAGNVHLQYAFPPQTRLTCIHPAAAHLFKQGCIHNTTNARQSAQPLAVLSARSKQLMLHNGAAFHL